MEPTIREALALERLAEMLATAAAERRARCRRRHTLRRPDPRTER